MLSGASGPGMMDFVYPGATGARPGGAAFPGGVYPPPQAMSVPGGPAAAAAGGTFPAGWRPPTF